MSENADAELAAMRRRIRAVQPYWHAEAIDKVARATVAGNRAYGLALDSNDTLTRDINAFFAKDQTMPMSSSPSAAIPASLNDNYTGSNGGNRFVGGMQFHHRNGNASDQPAIAEGFLNTYSALPDDVQLQIFQTLASYFGFDLGEETAEDQASMRLPNGNGVQPGEFFENQMTTGTFAERDRLTSPRATADARPRTMRQRRLGQDQRQAQDAAYRQRHQQVQSFAERFPHVAAVEVWGR